VARESAADHPAPSGRGHAARPRWRGPPTRSPSPGPAVVNAPDSGLDWPSAGIAAAGLFAIALVGIAGRAAAVRGPDP
jgi:hypothetical protein